MNNSTSTISPAWPTRWPNGSFRFWPTFGVIAASLGVTVVVLLAGIAWLVHTHPEILHGVVPIVPALVLQLFIEIGVVGIILATLPRLSGFSLRELGFTAPSLQNVGTAVVGAIIMAVVVNGSATLIETLMHAKHDQKVVEMFKHVQDPKTLLFFAVFAIVIAPFAEESMFRVFAFNVGLRYRGFWFGSVVSGALFGLAHGDMVAALPLTLGGIVLASIYYRTRNAFSSMITHGLFNSLTVFALIFAPNLAK